ncbi:MAG: XdhC family protein [Betaproteobacteria bacterium]|nr:XdhC family protein [Betaproteobacteria bacterium]MDE2122813.1 XdhC family protein [Betaproteobacteria bacterium]MDE2186480.1 XdhC family protein [Betaproteobacteria bacterium]MDE2324437.1 XdhC family protein [Betaproteobacteria bacterium]
MENIDLLVLRTLRDWRQARHHALLATVTRTWGSSPRPVGSIMALRDDGAVAGSVSGGCIEDDLIDRYTAINRGAGTAVHFPSGAPQRVQYGISADEAHRFGLPCGGTLELVLEFDPDPALLAELVTALEAGRLMHRHLGLDDGRVWLQPAAVPSDVALDAHVLVNTFGPEYRMLLIGAGQLAAYLATMALFCGFAVTVCDPREEYRAGWNVPGAKLLTEMPDDVVTAFNPDRRSCVVALTHDPKLDDLALLEAIHTDAFYVGAIGSRRNNGQRKERLIVHFEQTELALERLRGPIGIYIGSKTPPEIAVSVMAEILAVKNGVPLPRDLDVRQAKDQLGVDANDPGTVTCFVAS